MSENLGSSTPSPGAFGDTRSNGLISQWGGKFALFFTYMHLSHDLITGLLPALLPFIRQDMGLSYLQAGFLVSAFSLTAGFSQLFGGWVSDRISKPRAIAIGLGGVSLSAIAVSFAHSYAMLIVLLIALGVFAGFYHPSAISALSTQIEVKKRGRAVALHMLGGSLGFGLGPFAGAIIASTLNWHLAYIILGMPTLLAAALVLTRLKLEPVPEQKNLSPTTQPQPRKPDSVWGVFKPAIGIISVSVAMQLITGPVMSFASLFLTDVHHLSAEAGSMWVSIIRLGGLGGNVIGGWLTDRWGRRNTIFLTLSIFGLVVLLLARLPFGFALGAAFILFGCLMNMRETTMQTLLMDNSPPRLRATIIGIYFSFGQQGSSIIQPLAGDLMDATGIQGVFNAIAFVSIGLSVLAVFFSVKNRKRVDAAPTEALKS